MEVEYVGKCLLLNIDGKKILVIGDLHLGYSESLRRSGALIPGDSFKEVVRELGKIMEKTGNVNEIVLLGDLKHEFGGISNAEWREIKELLDYLKKKGKVIIVKGNHDKITEVITKQKGLGLVDYYIIDGVAFVHGDRKLEESEIYDKKIKYWVIGHGHPAIKITDNVKEEKYKCFLVGKYKKKDVIIVPSFFDVNLGSDPRDFDLGLAWKFDLMRFVVRVIEGLDVLNFGELGKLNY